MLVLVLFQHHDYIPDFEIAALDSFSIKVTNVNDAPTISGSPDIKAVQDVPYSRYQKVMLSSYLPLAFPVNQVGQALTQALACYSSHPS